MVPVIQRDAGALYSQKRRRMLLYTAAFGVFCMATAVVVYHNNISINSHTTLHASPGNYGLMNC
ncbi:hypothetical protein BS47DRAFT_1458520 [Hydnum rufescens UP504]|uniref:Uncharacterized protein n=1 Tax=Hydnum rufescens UP504 TaxID=1448309 RepID=A0A9P6DW56_9AGAM|nr:hypothetical protein BS47DRAFT_1458520 [Hydnum rufescens UP504]